MARVTESQVRGLTGDGSDVDASPAIDAANLFVNEEIPSTVSDARKVQIELWLAAHFLDITKRSPLAAETVGESSERYHNIYHAGLRSTRFGQQAILLDTSGVLADIAAKAEDLDRKSAQFQVI